MKNIVLILMVIIFTANVFAQRDSITGNDDEIKTIFGKAKSHGGYGAPCYKFTLIDNTFGYQNGGRGGWIINHTFVLGGGGYSFSTLKSAYDSYLDNNYHLVGGYGGLLLECVLFYKWPVHLAVPLLIGAGGISYVKSDQYDNVLAEDARAFFVVEPGMEIEFNLLKWMHLNIGAYYRYTQGNSLRYTSVGIDDDDSLIGRPIGTYPEDVLNDFSFGITLKFGKF